VKRNWNAEHQQRHRTRRQQMKKAGKSICLTDTRHEVQARIPSGLCQTREVCVWIPKYKAGEARISETLPHIRDDQQCEVRVSSQRHETHVSTTERETHEVCVSQVSPTNATISNARSASFISRGTRPASQSQNVRAASVLQNVNSASPNPAPLKLASRSNDAR